MKKKVLLIAVDGCRPDAMLFADTPNTKKLIDSGAYSFHAKTASAVSLSGPNWASILTGLTSKHGVDSNVTIFGDLNGHQNMFELVKNASPIPVRTFLAIANHGKPPWPGIENILSAKGCDEYRNFSGLDDVANLEEAISSCTLDADLNVVYTHLVDAVGHKYGFGLHIPEYKEAIESFDRSLGELIERVDGRKNEDWLILMITDHGGTARSSMTTLMENQFDTTDQYHKGVSQKPLKGVHGLDIPQHRNVFFILAKANDLISGEILPAPNQVDVVPTILHHLEIDIDNIDGELDGAYVGFAKKRMEHIYAENLFFCSCCFVVSKESVCVPVK